MSADIEVQLRAELAELREQQKQLGERVGALRKRLSYPYVTPVLVFYRYGARVDDEYWVSSWDVEDPRSPLQEAFEQLLFNAMEEQCSPIGVSVGGHLYSEQELHDLFPDSHDRVGEY